jgi:hypothetical protein
LELAKGNTSPDYDHPYNLSTSHRQAASQIIAAFNHYTEWLLKQVIKFWKANAEAIPDIETRKTRFLTTVSDSNRPFVKAFISTQQFSTFVNDNMAEH